ncbi:MAG: Xaa-Pro aminopeptidase [Symbiopectobacterium sp.]
MIQQDAFGQEYTRRRQQLLEKMAPASAAIFFAAPEATRSADSEYLYRQNSDFWYFTGFNEPEAVLLLVKSDEHHHTVLFNRVRDVTAEIWFGRRLGQEAAPSRLNVDRALPFSDINAQLHLLLNGLEVIYHAQGLYEYADCLLFNALKILRNGTLQGLIAPPTQTDWRPWVHEMRLFKSPKELELMRRAGEITAKAHTRAMISCEPGMYEYQLEGEIHHEFTCHGARYPSYNTIVGSGDNGCILHYTENERQMREGDLVLIDAGCEYQGYAGDITRTFPVSGKFSPLQRAIYNIVLASQRKALALFKPGVSIRKVNEQVIRIIVEGLVKLGVLKGSVDELKGSVDELIAEQAHRSFYMHGLSHWLGLDVHDVGDYDASERSRLLEPGMVLTVEPGLYIAPDAKVPHEYRGIGIRIEDDTLITDSGNEVLTAGVVKDADDIEALMAQARAARQAAR